MNRYFTVLATLYILIGASATLIGWRSEDDRWIVSAATRIPMFDPYSHYRSVNSAPPLGAPVGFPPILLLIVYPFVYIGQRLGWDISQISRVYKITLLFIDIVNIFLIVDFIKKLSPSAVKRYLLPILFVLFFSGYFLYSSGYAGHPETLVLFFSLLGIRKLIIKKYLLSGILFALAFLSKQSAIFVLIPVVLYLISRQKKMFLRFLVGFLSTFIIILFPFFISDFDGTLYGLVGYTSFLKIHGPNIWWLIDTFARRILNLNSVYPYLIKIANAFLLVSSLAASFYFMTNVKKPQFLSRDVLVKVFGIISLNLLLFSILGKWISFHYFLLNFVFILLWDIGRRPGTFPFFWLIYSFSLFSASFIAIPIWQFMVLFINMTALIYVAKALVQD